MEPVYKVVNVNVEQNNIYVFIGNKGDENDLNTLYTENPNDPLFDGIFTPEEIKDITEKKPQIIFISDRVHLDDTIETIKKKLLWHLKDELYFTFDEIYLFIKQLEKLNPISLYNKLTQSEKNITKERLEQFLINIDGVDISSLPDKETYDYSDIVKLNIEDTFTINKTLGQEIISNVKTPYPYTINPFDVH